MWSHSSFCASPCPARPPGARPARRPAFRRPAWRPRVEALEDRCVPSAAGSLDPTFGNGAGYVTTSINSFFDQAGSTLIQPDGKILAVGRAGTSTGAELAVERYNPDGSLDTSFGSGGIALASFGPSFAMGPQSALYPQAGTANDGKIVQEGTYQGQIILGATTPMVPSTPPSALAARSRRPDSRANLLRRRGGRHKRRPDRGASATTAAHIVVARYNTNGSLDTTFGQGGEVITSVPAGVSGSAGFNNFHTLLQQPDGKLIGVDRDRGRRCGLDPLQRQRQPGHFLRQPGHRDHPVRRRS